MNRLNKNVLSFTKTKLRTEEGSRERELHKSKRLQVYNKYDRILKMRVSNSQSLTKRQHETGSVEMRAGFIGENL